MVDKIVKNGVVTPDEWVWIAQGEKNEIPDGKVILSLQTWQQHYQTLSARNEKPGLWLSTDELPENFPGDLKILPVIAVYFPAFTDGRGFSLGNLLRERFAYQGELRACGGFIHDQLFYLKRCGFNAFKFDPSVNIEEAIKSLHDFSDGYQIASDQKIPLFRRRR